MSIRTLSLALTFCLAGLLADSRAENLRTIDGQVAPGLSWQSSRTVPRNAVPFITIKKSNGSFGVSTQTHFIVRVKMEGDWRLGTVSTYYIPVDRGGGGGASQSIERAKVLGNTKVVKSEPYAFQYLVADQKTNYRWDRITGPMGPGWKSEAYRVPGNAIDVGRHMGRRDRTLPVVPGRIPEVQVFGELLPSNWYVIHESKEEPGYIGETDFSDVPFIEFLISAKVAARPKTEP